MYCRVGGFRGAMSGRGGEYHYLTCGGWKRRASSFRSWESVSISQLRNGSGERVHFEAGKSKRIPTQCTQRKVRANTSVPQRQHGGYRIKRNYSPVLRDAGATGAAFSVVAGAVFGTRQPAAVVDFSGCATLARTGPVSFMRVRTQSIVAGMAPCALPFSA